MIERYSSLKYSGPFIAILISLKTNISEKWKFIIKPIPDNVAFTFREKFWKKK